MPTFTPPTVYDRPPILPDSTGPARRLFKWFPNRARYVNVFELSNGTFVQDTPTSENSNSSVPYPWNPNDPQGPFSTSYYTDYSQNPPVQVKATVAQDPWIVTVYYGPTVIDSYQALALTAAGYGDLIS